MCVCMYVCSMYVCMYVCSMYVCSMYVCVYVCMHACMCVCVCVCMHVCMYVLCVSVCVGPICAFKLAKNTTHDTVPYNVLINNPPPCMSVAYPLLARTTCPLITGTGRGCRPDFCECSGDPAKSTFAGNHSYDIIIIIIIIIVVASSTTD
jgi:hypothetical protein